MGLFDKILGKSNKIKVKFIDNSNGQIIGVSEMQADQLPTTFSVQTTMHIRENDWSIEQAIPENAEEFIKSKQLILKMRKIEYVNTNDIWFSLPSIENSFPNLTNQPLFKDFIIQIHEDDWLQQEFVSAENSEQIENILDQIRESAKENKESDEMIIYKKCFTRKFPTTKLNEAMYLSDILKELEVDKVGSLGFSNDHDFAENVFVIEALGTYLYGELNKDNSLRTLAVYDIRSITNTAQLENFAKKMKLNFVDWTGMIILF